MHTKVRSFGAIALIIAAMGLAACGSDDDSSNSSSPSTTTESKDASTTTAADPDFDAVAEGEKAADKAGGSVELPKKKIGFLNIIHAIESAARAEAAFKTAGEELGWEVISCDGQGDPTKIAACADTLLNQGAEAIATNGVEAAQIKPALEKAKSDGIPFVECTSDVSPSKLFAGEYGPDEAAAGKLAADFLIKQILASDRDKTIAVHSFPTGFASKRTQALLDALKEHPEIKVVDTVDTDLADPAGSTQKAVDAELTRFPKLGAIWVAFDIAIPGAAQSVQQKYPGAGPGERPILTGFNANTASLQWMKRGVIDALSDTAFENTCWVAVDQFAEYYARDTKVAQAPDGGTFAPDYGFDYVKPQLVTKDNIPGKPASDAVDPMPQPYDAPAFFKAKWAKEFGG